MKTTWRVVTAAGILLALAVLALRVSPDALETGWRRYRFVNKIILNTRDVTARAHLMPVRKTFDAGAVGGHAVDIGYAKFAVSEEEAPLLIRVKGSAGTGVVMGCKDFNIVFLNPSPPTQMDEDSRSTMKNDTRDYPKAAAFMQESYSDEVASQVASEEIRPATFVETCAMTQDDYLLYTQKLIRKIAWTTGMDEVFWFENAQTKGIARIVKITGAHKVGRLELSSPDGGKLVECIVETPIGKPDDAGKMIDQIASSFVFTIDNIADKDQIKRRIAAAGIGK